MRGMTVPNLVTRLGAANVKTVPSIVGDKKSPSGYRAIERVNAFRRMKNESGLSGRQFTKLRKTMARAQRQWAREHPDAGPGRSLPPHRSSQGQA